MAVLNNQLNLANMHNMKTTDYEKWATDTKYAKPKEETKLNKENLPDYAY